MNTTTSPPANIYTREPIAVPTEEHVLLNALGGKLKALGIIDKELNDNFGHTIDAALDRALLPIRVLLNAHSGDGQPPPAFKNATSEAGESFNILPGGKPEPGKPKATFENGPDGTTRITAHARSMNELHRMLRRKLDQLGVSREQVEAAATKVQEKAPPLNFQLVFERASWRGIAKMACNLLAVHDRRLFMDAAFDPIRKFVLEDGEPRDFVVFNTRPVDLCKPTKRLGPLDHAIVVRGDRATGKVEGLVVLFGHVQLCVRLGTLPLERSFVTTYRVDQLDGIDRHDHAEDRGLSVRDFAKVASASDGARFDAVGKGMNQIFSFMTKGPPPEEVFHEIVRDCWNATIGPPDGKLITEEKLSAFSSLLAERFVDLLVENGQLEAVAARLDAQGAFDD